MTKTPPSPVFHAPNKHGYTVGKVGVLGTFKPSRVQHCALRGELVRKDDTGVLYKVIGQWSDHGDPALMPQTNPHQKYPTFPGIHASSVALSDIHNHWESA